MPPSTVGFEPQEIESVSRTHTIVIGAGIIGVSCAYYLAKRGHRVTLIDKGEIGSGASFGPAGIIAVGHPPMPRPGLVRQTLRWMFDGSSPLYVPPRLDLDLWRWLWKFSRACTPKHEAYCMEFLGKLGAQAGACFETIVSEADIPCDYRPCGWLEVFRSEEGQRRGEHDAQLLRRYNFDVDVLSGDEVRDREPMLKPGVVGALHYVQSAIADPHQFLVKLAEQAQRHGARLLVNTELRRIVLSNGRFVGVCTRDTDQIDADTIVLAAGPWTTKLAASIGLDIPMQPGKGYHRNITRPDPCLSTACVLAEGYIAVTPMSGFLRLSGTVEFSGMNHRLVTRRLNMLSNAANVFLEGIDQSQTISEWCGLRPCTADGLPVVGWAPNLQGVFIATGHARMGFTLGPVTGKLVAESILDGTPSIDLTPLRVNRFTHRRRRPIAAGL